MPADKPTLTRDLPLIPVQSALLVVDMQNYCCQRDGGMFKGLEDERVEREFGFYLRRLDNIVVPNLQRAISACRHSAVEVIYTTIEALTADGRDRSLDYKISGVHVPRGSRDGRVLDALRPGGDEIRLPKTASSPFNATNIDYVLHNLGVERLAIAGVLTDRCVESAVRDACDRGFLVTLLEDACATLSAERHAHALRSMNGYCRQLSTDALVAELAIRP